MIQVWCESRENYPIMGHNGHLKYSPALDRFGWPLRDHSSHRHHRICRRHHHHQNVKNKGKGFKAKKESKRTMTTIGHLCIGKRSLES